MSWFADIEEKKKVAGSGEAFLALFSAVISYRPSFTNPSELSTSFLVI